MKLYLWIMVLGGCWFSNTVYAGMPSVISVSEIGTIRLSTISFFLLIYVISAWILLKLWNFLRKDFSSLPALSFKKSLSLIFLWGLAFMLILVMISGARELMTPRAWEKQGSTYKLTKESQFSTTTPTPAPSPFSLMEMRQNKLKQLGKELLRFAEQHQGEFPVSPKESGISDLLWISPVQNTSYIYAQKPNQKNPSPFLVYEPEAYGAERLVLLRTGQVELIPFSAIQEMEEVDYGR